jgi:hypothetical protein
MKPHDRLTLVRNRYRVRQLRTFREQVMRYFQASERDVNDVPADWEVAQQARARINQMLAGVVGVVRAAGLGGWREPTTTDPGQLLGRVELLQQIFSIQTGDPMEQEIYDLLDMAIGVYQGGGFAAAVRTINPLHYAGTFLAFLGRGPRRMLGALGIGRRSGDAPMLERQLVVLQERMARREAELTRQLAEMAERLDFAERVISEERPSPQLKAPDERETPTPV